MNKNLDELVVFKENVLLRDGYSHHYKIGENKSLYIRGDERILTTKNQDGLCVYDSFRKYKLKEDKIKSPVTFQLDLFDTFYKGDSYVRK